jgi:hypothetical protein
MNLAIKSAVQEMLQTALPGYVQLALEWNDVGTIITFWISQCPQAPNIPMLLKKCQHGVDRCYVKLSEADSAAVSDMLGLKGIDVVTSINLRELTQDILRDISQAFPSRAVVAIVEVCGKNGPILCV